MSSSFPVEMKAARNICHDEFLSTPTGHRGRAIVKSLLIPPGVPMIEFANTWFQLKLDRRAVTALEYGLIAGVIVASIMVGFSVLANSLSQSFSTIGDSL
jgi:Flp pilus assembly pilin Flp